MIFLNFRFDYKIEMGGGPSKEELEHKEYMERKRLERQKEENEHKERMKGKLNFRMPAKS